MSVVQTNTITGQAASGDLGYIFPTDQQPVYASRFSDALENLAENGSNAVPFLSVPVASNGIVTLGRSLATPTAIQTPAAQTADMTMLFVARLPNAPVAGDANAGVMGGTFYKSTQLNGWNGATLVINNGCAYTYIGVSTGTSVSTEFIGPTITNDQAQAWGLYASRINSSNGSTVSVLTQALTAGVSQSLTFTGTFENITGETPTVMLGADYIPYFGTKQPVQINRAFVWNYSLADVELDAVCALIRADLAADGITV